MISGTLPQRVQTLQKTLKQYLTLLFVILVPVASVVQAQAPIPVTHDLMRELLPDATRFSEKAGDPPVYQAFAATQDGTETLVGYLFETPDLPPEEIGYAAPIDVLVAMDLEGTITGIRIVYYRESYRSIRGDFLNSERFPNQFEGKHLSEEFRVGRDVDGVSRATISSWAMSRGIRNAARRVARAYMRDLEGIGSEDSGALAAIEAMSWEEMRANGLIVDMTVEYRADSRLDLQFVFIGSERMGELLVGANDFSTAEREASNRVSGGQLMLVGIGGNSNSTGNPFRPERLGIRQGENFFPLPRRHFVYAGSGTAGKITSQVNFAGAMVLDEGVDITRPLSLEYDIGDDMGAFSRVQSVAFQLPPVGLALAQGLPWNEAGDGAATETGLARLINEAEPIKIATLLALFALVMTAFLLKSAPLRWGALASTLVYLGFVDGGFLSISHITSGLKVGPAMYLNDGPLLLLILFTLVTTLLWGRVFCSSLCPFGALQDFLTRLVPRRFQLTVPQQIHDWAIYIKYAILVLILVTSLAWADVMIFHYFEPFGTVFTGSPSIILWLILAFFLLSASVIKRFYCRYACPLGAALGVISLLSPNRIKRVEQCGICKVCEHACPTGAIRGPRIDFKECVRCDVCEAKLIHKAGVCKHSMDDVRARVKDWQPIAVS